MAKLKKLKWTRSNVAKLSNAVRSFNKEVEKHYEDMDIKALPKLLTYRDVKDRILTKKDLELTLSTLKKIKNKNAFNLESSSSNPNVQYIHWSKMTAERLDKIHQANMTTEAENIRKQFVSKAKKVKIGDQEYNVIHQMSSPRLSQLESYLERPNIEMLESAGDYERLHLYFDRILKYGFDSSIKDMGKIYQENYLRMFEGYQNLQGYDEAVEIIKNMKPEDFYEWAKRNDVNYDDFHEHYDNRLLQGRFSELISTLGVDTSGFEDTEDSIEFMSENFLDTL